MSVTSAPVIRFSDGLWQDLKVIRAFLFKRMYRAPSVVEMREKVTVVVDDLFPLFMQNPSLLPDRWQGDLDSCAGETAVARKVSDYISGMTDRYALQEHARLLGK
jgi:dGTPase